MKKWRVVIEFFSEDFEIEADTEDEAIELAEAYADPEIWYSRAELVCGDEDEEEPKAQPPLPGQLMLGGGEVAET